MNRIAGSYVTGKGWLYEEYYHDVRLRYVGAKGGVTMEQEQKTRGAIVGLTPRSAKRLGHTIHNAVGEWVSIVHLTYPSSYPGDGKAVKSHLHYLLQYLKGKGMTRYLWVLEFQERGAPHFHLLTDAVIDKDWLSETWYRIVGSGDRLHLLAGTRVEGVKSQVGIITYIQKYLQKAEQKQVPAGFQNVGRMWGASRGLAPVIQAGPVNPKRGDKIVRVMRHYLEKKIGHKLRNFGRGRRGLTVYNGVVMAQELLCRDDWG